MPKKTSKNQKGQSLKSDPFAKKLLAGATLTGSLLLSSGSQSIKALPDKPPELRAPLGLLSSKELMALLKDLISNIIPQSPRVLSNLEEEKLEHIIQKTLGIKAVADLDGNRLNHQLGYMGLEQHLMRFPGDISLAGRNFPQAGVAPGKAAWGYFASSKNKLSSQDLAMEKYYVAVQTLYLPDWQVRLGELRDWYKYRKVLVINPDNGAAVVAVIADAGPAKWTGKQFGGSPEVMHGLGLYPKRTKGKTIVLFVDDPQNKIPLGPVTYPYTASKPKQV
jgi:hypothetical protein